MPSAAPRRAAMLLALLSFAIPTAPARAAASPEILGPRLKQLQHRLLLERARERYSHEDEMLPRVEPAAPPARRAISGARGAPGRAAVAPRAGRRVGAMGGSSVSRAVKTAGAKRGTSLGPVKESLSAAPGTTASVRAASPARANAFAPNVRVNDPSLDGPVPPGGLKVGQGEEGIAALDNNILIAYNDGQGCVTGVCSGHTQGYSYSTDGGKSFKDGGAPPALAGWTWLSDPVVMVDEKRGNFWYCGLVVTQTSGGAPTIAVARANFVGDTLIWGVPALIRDNTGSVYIDKPWMAVDSLSGRVYVIYTVFDTQARSDTIDFQASANGVAWGSPVTLSANADAGEVQGGRVVIGPSGEVYTTWFAIGTSEPYADYFRFRSSTDQGNTFSAPSTVTGLYSNFSSGAPGFNRERGITFPAMAVDRSPGPYRNRIYVTWNEGVDIFHDQLIVHGRTVELEPNNIVVQANAFTIGDTIHGELTAGDIDFFKFSATQGQTVVFFAGRIDPSLDASMRILCTDGTTLLAYSEPGAGQNNLIQFTIPATGIYYLRMRQFSGSGQYTIFTLNHAHQAGDRSRDHRDAFAAFSNDSGRTWATPLRVNDEPGWLDDWLPEVAVSGQGKPYIIWYDWRDAPASTCGGQSQVYLGRSDDGGASWTTLGSVTDALSNWTASQSNIAPNQGDYLGLFANNSSVFPTWADARDSSVDVWTVRLPLATTPTQLSLANVAADPQRVSLSWYWSGSAGQIATVYRRTDGTPWDALGNAVADGTDLVSFVDGTVTPGTRYAYRLGIHDETGVTYSAEVWVDVPDRPLLAIQGVRPNPTDHDVWVSYSLPLAAPAKLELLDIAGRRVVQRAVAGRPGAFTVNLAENAVLRPGIYLVKLTQAGRAETARVTIVR